MSDLPEYPVLLPPADFEAINQRIAKSVDKMSKKLSRAGSIEVFHSNVVSKLRGRDAKLIDWLATGSFPDERQLAKRRSVRVGLCVGMVLGRKILGDNWLNRRQSEIHTPTLASVFAIYATARNSAALDLSDYLKRSGRGAASIAITSQLPPALKSPYEYKNQQLQAEVNDLYVGSLCLLAADSVVMLQERAMLQNAQPNDRDQHKMAEEMQQYLNSLGPAMPPEQVERWQSQYRNPPTYM